MMNANTVVDYALAGGMATFNANGEFVNPVIGSVRELAEHRLPIRGGTRDDHGVIADEVAIWMDGYSTAQFVWGGWFNDELIIRLFEPIEEGV